MGVPTRSIAVAATLVVALLVAACAAPPPGTPGPVATPSSAAVSVPPSATPASATPTTPASAPPTPLTSVAGTWRVRRVLSPDSPTTLVASTVYDDQTYVITPGCETEPCDTIEVRVTPLGLASPERVIAMRRDGDTYVSAEPSTYDGICVTPEGDRIAGGATVVSTQRLWLTIDRPEGTAVETTLITGAIKIEATPSSIGEAAGCDAQMAIFDVSGRRGAVTVRDPDATPRPGDGGVVDKEPPEGARLVALPSLSVRIGGATVRYFDVAGDTVAELADSIARGGADACGEIDYEWYRGDSRPAACALTRFTDTEEALTTRVSSTGACTITDADVEGRYTIYMPRWTSPSRVPARLLAWWRDVLEYIRDHEAGHVRISRDYVERLNERLGGIDCEDADRVIGRWARQFSDAQEAYDRHEYAQPWPEPPVGY